ncbi:MAG: hypothetical protein ACXVAM_10795 [Vulcanimicrobiaceae bacterium]
MNNEWRFRIAFKGDEGASLREAIRAHVLPLARSDRATRVAINVDP